MATDDDPVRFDYHVHSNYSDGGDLAAMVEAAADCGLDGVGVADHCNVTDPDLRSHPVYSLHETHEERRAEIRDLRDRFDIRVFDAVELDFDPDAVDRLRRFLQSAGFEYSLGSVHHVDDRNVMHPPAAAEMDERGRERLVEEYFDAVVALVESELFDIVSHLDVLTRNPHLREFPERRHYERVATALRESRTVPEINLGRVLHDGAVVHPDPAHLGAFAEEGIRFVVGTDAHAPAQIAERLDKLSIGDGAVELLDGPGRLL